MNLPGTHQCEVKNCHNPAMHVRWVAAFGTTVQMCEDHRNLEGQDVDVEKAKKRHDAVVKWVTDLWRK